VDIRAVLAVQDQPVVPVVRCTLEVLLVKEMEIFQIHVRLAEQ
jgi:hypothetical protein